MAKTPRRALTALATGVLLVGLLLLSGCGDSAGSTTDPVTTVDPAAEAAVQGALETAFTDSKPSYCTELFTVAGLKQFNPGGGDAVKKCEQNIDPKSDADSIEVEDLVVDGGTASARVTPKGGLFDGASVDVGLVDDGGWKLDNYDNLEIYNRARAERTGRTVLSESIGDSLTTADASCITAYMEDVPTSELERGILAGEPFYSFDAVRECLGGGQDLLTLIRLTETQLVNADIPRSTATCISSFIVPKIKNLTLEDLATDPKANRSYQEAIANAAQTECLGV